MTTDSLRAALSSLASDLDRIVTGAGQQVRPVSLREAQLAATCAERIRAALAVPQEGEKPSKEAIAAARDVYRNGSGSGEFTIPAMLKAAYRVDFGSVPPESAGEHGDKQQSGEPKAGPVLREHRGGGPPRDAWRDYRVPCPYCGGTECVGGQVCYEKWEKKVQTGETTTPEAGANRAAGLDSAQIMSSKRGGHELPAASPALPEQEGT